MEKTPGGYIPRFPNSASNPSSLIASLREAHANVIALRREFLARKGSVSGPLTQLAEEMSDRLRRECLPAVRAARERIAELATKAPTREVTNELDELAGKRFWNGNRDPLTSPVDVTDASIDLTLDWMGRESAARAC
jgi:hypothetical protein